MTGEHIERPIVSIELKVALALIGIGACLALFWVGVVAWLLSWGIGCTR